MPVNVLQWREGFGTFYQGTHLLITLRNTASDSSNYVLKVNESNLHSSYVFFALESNLGPKKKFFSSFSCCHWNVNSLLAHSMLKFSLLEE